MLGVQYFFIFHTDFKHESPQICVTLENVGLGPAIIDSYKVYLDEKEYSTKGTSPMHEIGKELAIPACYGGGKVYEPFDAIPKDKEVVIFELHISKEPVDSDVELLNAVSEVQRIKIEVIYKSVYGKVFWATYNLS